MSETIIILMNMRGNCVTVGEKVHTLLRVGNRRIISKAVSERAEQSSTRKLSTTAFEELI